MAKGKKTTPAYVNNIKTVDVKSGLASAGKTPNKEMQGLMSRDASTFFKGGTAPTKEEILLQKMK